MAARGLLLRSGKCRIEEGSVQMCCGVVCMYGVMRALHCIGRPWLG